MGDTKKKDFDTSFDPFISRDIPTATTDMETFMHLLKASVGTGLLAMPVAFRYVGLMLGIFATIFVAFTTSYCCYTMVVCAHRLYYRCRIHRMTYPEIAEQAFITGPQRTRNLAGLAKFLVMICLFMGYFGICSVYTVIVAKNLDQVFEHWWGWTVNIRIMILAELIPLILLCWVPNLKILAPISTFANVVMGIALAITVAYIFQDLPDITGPDYFHPLRMPAFIAICLFAIEAVGVMMPLENNMKNPTHFVGICGVLVTAMIFITFIYGALGFFGYWRYGEATADSITLNLPVEQWPAQVVKFCIAVAIFCTFGLQFYILFEIFWKEIEHKFTTRPIFYNYLFRTLLVITIVLTAVVVPTIAAFMGLIGALCFASLGLAFPAIIEPIVLWDVGFGRCNWIIWKNIFIFFVGVAAMIFGIIDAMENIIDLYRD